MYFKNPYLLQLHENETEGHDTSNYHRKPKQLRSSHLRNRKYTTPQYKKWNDLMIQAKEESECFSSINIV